MRMKLLAGVAAVLTVVAGCGTPETVEPEEKGEVVIAMENWAGYQANAAVLGYLLKTKLGYNVIYEELGGESTWKEMSKGNVDIIAEDWGKFQAKEGDESLDYNVAEFAEVGRYTGINGQIGWYMPTWMTEEYDGIEDYQKLNEFADVLTDESGGKAQLLIGDDDYISNEEALINNLNLQVELVSAGSEEELIKAARESEDKKKPVMFYFWSPHWLFTEISLTAVEFPKYNPQEDKCTVPAKIACDYPEVELNTVVASALKDTDPEAYSLVHNFNWTESDQNQVAFDITEGGMAPEDAAKKWLDSHADQWQTWLTA